jgi:CubicO group peptidase (beta-lactamase class C family)
MKDTGFTVGDASRLAVAYADGSPKPVRMGDVHVVKMPYGPGSIRFAPSRVFNGDSYPSGGCGMAGTAGDFARFLEALRTGGGSVLNAESVKAMTTDQTGCLGPAPGTAFGYGVSVITDPELAQTPQSVGTFTWGGVYGHTWFVDGANGLSAVSLTNTAVEGLAGRFPVEIRDAIYAAL